MSEPRQGEIVADTPFLAPLVAKLRRHPKRIVFPEGNDPRVIETAAKLVELEAAAPLLLGDPDAIRATASQHGQPLDHVAVIDPPKSSDFGLFCDRFKNIEHYRANEVDDPRPIVGRPDYFAAMMVQYGQADAIVGGNQEEPVALFRTLFRMIKPQQGIGFASSVLVLELPAGSAFGADGVLFLADTAVLPDPTAEQLAAIAVESGKLAAMLLGHRPKVALLSYANKGSSSSDSTKKVASATALAKAHAERDFLEMDIDGELQVDVAIVPEVSERKCGRNLIHGAADVLIFPDLNSGHISSKLLQHVAGAQPYGHLVLGLSRPAAQVSRVANPQTIFGTAITMGVKAISYRDLIAAEGA